MVKKKIKRRPRLKKLKAPRVRMATVARVDGKLDRYFLFKYLDTLWVCGQYGVTKRDAVRFPKADHAFWFSKHQKEYLQKRGLQKSSFVRIGYKPPRDFLIALKKENTERRQRQAKAKEKR